MQSKTYLSNAFSLNMLNLNPEVPAPVKLFVRPIDLERVKSLLQLGFESAVGHQSTAEILSNLLEIEVPVNRVAIKLQSGDILIVFQLGVRLAEGQVLSKEEVFDLYSKGQASFVMVEVV
ncbi:DNA binding protein [uncultured virus]|uniref:DNA binding protein n=1 Tax=uncultured virus TaxID=340016 RepID=A0A5Q0TWU5_9VIRU|nr:DNA binding protein [uncultured virus]